MYLSPPPREKTGAKNSPVKMYKNTAMQLYLLPKIVVMQAIAGICGTYWIVVIKSEAECCAPQKTNG